MKISMKPILPKAMKINDVRLEMLNALRKSGRHMKKDFNATTKTWKNKPEFEMAISLKTPPGPSVSVTTENEIYGYVDKGTKGPYEIRPKKPGGVLVFHPLSMPKTLPGIIGSGPGSTGADTAFAKKVIHPGIKARRFSKEIAKAHTPKFARLLNEALAKGIRKSGHSMK